ncbi:MAG: GTP-binding protein, partial [Pseudomonadota bacterium]
TEDQIAQRKSHHELHHEHHHAHDGDHDHHHHDHDDFESFVVQAGSVASADAFVAKLAMIIAEHDVLRCKGFVDVPGKPMRLVVQAVGGRIDTYFDRPWQPGEIRETRLVVIGLHGLQQAVIEEAVKAAVS